MTDKRAFAQFDVGYLDNPKISDVFDASPIAVCMHIASVLYCAQHLTDGYIALRAMQRKAGGTNEDSQLLLEAGLWHEPGHGCEGCPEVPEGKLYVHDYLQHNRTSEGVKGKSDAAKIGAKARWAKERKAKETPDAIRIAAEADPQCLEREKEREKEPSSPLTLVPTEEAKKPETKIPTDWAPTASHLERAKAKGVNVIEQAEAFKLHAETHDRRAASWNAAFTSWLVKSKPTITPQSAASPWNKGYHQ
jgi:hypothetical protein